MRTAYRNIPVAIVVHVFYALALTTAFWHQDLVSHQALTLWFGSIVLLGASRALSVWRFLRSPDRDQRWGVWAVTATFFAGLFGVLWASAVVVFMDFREPLTVVLLVVVPVGLTAGSAAAMAAFPPMYFAFLLVVVPTLIIVAATADTVLGYVIAAMLLLFTVADSIICLSVHKALDQALRLRLENELLREEAERANSAKSKFLAAASHDLRQPLHALGLFFSTLKEETETPRTAPLLVHVDECISALGKMLNALLDISKLDAGVVEPERSTLSIGNLFERLSSELEGSAREHRVKLRFRPCDALVVSDPAMLERMVRNLVSNALGHAHGSRALVAGRRRGARLRLEVWDNGRGIAPHHQQEIFQEFRQLDNPERDRNKGLGLGLAIVRRLADLLDHPLQLRSRPGHGSCFSIELPLSTSTCRSAPLTVSGLPGDSAQQVRRRLLVLDDDRLVRKAMEALLSRWGYEVRATGSLDAALELVASEPPDLLVVDFRLQNDTTGTDAIDALHTRAERNIPCILITGDTAPDRLREAASLGYPLLHKPVQPARFRAALRRQLQAKTP